MGRSGTPLWSEEFTSLSLVTAENRSGTWYATEPYLSQGLVGEVDPGSSLTWNANPNEPLGPEGLIMNPFSVGPVLDSAGEPASDDSALTISCRRYATPEREALVATHGSAPGSRWGGTLISNHAVRTFSYGYIEFRACFPRAGFGMWPALWLFAAFGANGPDRGGAEIDVLEIFGAASGSPWYCSMHELEFGQTAAPGFNGSLNGLHEGTDDTSRWHTYGVDWQGDALTFYRDRRPVARRSGRDAEFYRGVTMAIRMNYTMTAVGAGARSGPEEPSTPDPLTMCVDYVRQWSDFAACGGIDDLPSSPVSGRRRRRIRGWWPRHGGSVPPGHA
jgi:hypothetical protein